LIESEIGDQKTNSNNNNNNKDIYNAQNTSTRGVLKALTRRKVIKNGVSLSVVSVCS
jgi:hypothetical protein